MENTGIDIPTFFGAGSPEATRRPATAPARRRRDVRRLRRHRRPLRTGSAICSASTNAHADLLPDEPGGYSGFEGLFGAKYVDPVIKPGSPMTDLGGNVIQDPNGHVGFPGFDGMEATSRSRWSRRCRRPGSRSPTGTSRTRTTAHGTSGNIHFAYGPGEAGYVQQLTTTTTASSSSSTAWPRTGSTSQHAVPVHRRRGRPLRRRPAEQPVRRRHHAVQLHRQAASARSTATCRRMVKTQLRRRHDELHASTPTTRRTSTSPATRRETDASHAEPRAGDVAAELANPYTGVVQNNIMRRAGRHGGDEDSYTWSRPIRPDADVHAVRRSGDWFFFATGGTRRRARRPAELRVDPGAARTRASPGTTATSRTRSHRPGPGTSGRASKNWRRSAATSSTDHTDVRPTMLTLTRPEGRLP